MTTGDLLVARVAMKPLATLNRPVLKTVDVETKEETVSFKERTDVTAVPGGRRRRRDDGRARARVGGAAQVRRRLARPSSSRNHDALPRVAVVTRVVSARHLVLVGLMGAGKTTVGRRCAERLGAAVRRHRRPRRVAPTGMPVDEIFATAGRGRRSATLEREVVADVCASPEPLVIACGGGAVLDPDNRRRLRDAGCRRVAARAARRCSRARVGDGREPAAARAAIAGGDARHGSQRSRGRRVRSGRRRGGRHRRPRRRRGRRRGARRVRGACAS